MGGSPYSRARRYSSSTAMASSSPAGTCRGLGFEAGTLVVGVDELAEGVGQLPAGHDGLEALGQVRVVAMAPGQRRHLGREVGDEHRAPQVGLGGLLEELEQELARPPRAHRLDARLP